MAAVRFYLKNSKAKLSPIYCLYDIRPREQFKYTIKNTRINPKEWNKASRRAKAGLKHKKLNILIQRIINHIEEIVLDFMIDGTHLDKEALRDELEIRLGTKQRKDKDDINLIEYIHTVIDRRKLDPDYSAGTIKNYRTLILNLERYIIFLHKGEVIKSKKIKTSEYISEHQITPLYVSEVTKGWHREWINYLYEYHSISRNYAAALTNRINTFLTLADEELNSGNKSYKDISVSEKDTYKIYLNDEELLKLYKYDYPHKYLRNAVNAFIIDSLIGFRYEDLSKFKIENHITEIDGEPYVRMMTNKSETPVVIPINPIVMDIYNSYEINMISNVNLNIYIKEAGEMAGITQIVEKVSYPAGKMKLEYLPKYKLITVHTARRSFATNMYKKNVPIRSIMMMTGHKSEEAFLRYLRINVEENAQLVKKLLDE